MSTVNITFFLPFQVVVYGKIWSIFQLSLSKNDLNSIKSDRSTLEYDSIIVLQLLQTLLEWLQNQLAFLALDLEVDLAPGMLLPLCHEYLPNSLPVN